MGFLIPYLVNTLINWILSQYLIKHIWVLVDLLLHYDFQVHLIFEIPSWEFWCYSKGHIWFSTNQNSEDKFQKSSFHKFRFNHKGFCGICFPSKEIMSLQRKIEHFFCLFPLKSLKGSQWSSRTYRYNYKIFGVLISSILENNIPYVKL
jgi:hypothetical protein